MGVKNLIRLCLDGRTAYNQYPEVQRLYTDAITVLQNLDEQTILNQTRTQNEADAIQALDKIQTELNQIQAGVKFRNPVIKENFNQILTQANGFVDKSRRMLGEQQKARWAAQAAAVPVQPPANRAPPQGRRSPQHLAAHDLRGREEEFTRAFTREEGLQLQRQLKAELIKNNATGRVFK